MGVAQLVGRRPQGAHGRVTPGELEVLGLMAEGRSNHGIATALGISEGAVEERGDAILGKLDVPAGPAQDSRVQAVLAFLRREAAGQ